MKIHLLAKFPGTNAGKTKDVEERYATELIKQKVAVSAEDGSKHPEPAKEEKPAVKKKPAEDMTTDKTDKSSAERKDKTEKSSAKIEVK